MILNHVPEISPVNPTGCCPQFEPTAWDGKTFEFKEKLFVRFTVHSFLYMPLNMGAMISRVTKSVDDSGALYKTENLLLSYDLSPWKSEHYLAVTKRVAGLENIKLSGKFKSKVFDGPYQDAPKWIKAMNSKNKVYLYYTTCPKCSKYYGHNFVVALAKI